MNGVMGIFKLIIDRGAAVVKEQKLEESGKSEISNEISEDSKFVLKWNTLTLDLLIPILYQLPMQGQEPVLRVRDNPHFHSLMKNI